MKLQIDTVVSKLAALGVPGPVLVAVMASSGWAGAAALTAALATLGGPIGMIGGVAVLGILLLLSQALAEYGFMAVSSGVVEKLHEQGTSDREILAKIDSYPIGADLKRKLKELLKQRKQKRTRSKKATLKKKATPKKRKSK
jgi:hypothetical protein